MRARAIAGALGLATVLVLLPATIAQAAFRGTDMWSNLAPAGHGGGLVDRYPISFYALDYHVNGPSIGLIVNASIGDIPALVAQFLASLIVMLFMLFMRVTISAFNWAFNVNIISGSGGAITPVGNATKHLYLSTFAPLLTDAVIIFGAWLVYKLASRRFGEAGSGALRAICLSVVALVIIFNPAATIGRAAGLFNELAGTIASGTTGANGGQDASDRIFRTFIYQPWEVLEFGGLKRCTSVEKDSDGFPRYVNGESPNSVCRDVSTRYAPAFLAHAPGSSARNDLFKTIRDGDAPYDKADAPAVDMMQAGGATQRLVFAIILAVGIASAILLLGLISIAALFAQLGLLVLVGVTPVMVIAGIFPGMHGIVFSWGKWIGKFLIAKVVYAVMLSAALGVSAALMVAGGTSQFGYLFAFAAQAGLFLGLFVKRKALAENLASRHEYRRAEHGARSFVTGAATAAVTVASAPLAAAGAAAAAGKERFSKQESASRPDDLKDSDPDSPATVGHDQPDSGRKLPADSSSPPASAGREYSPDPVKDATDHWERHGEEPAHLPSAGEIQSGVYDTVDRGEDPVPTRSFREDYAQAKADADPKEYGQQRRAPDVDPLEVAINDVHNGATASSFAQQLEQERAKTPNT